MEELINKLKSKFANSDDLELREGAKSIRSEYSSSDLKFFGFYSDIIEVDGEEITVAKDTVIGTPVSVLAFTAGGIDYEARYGTVAHAAKLEEEARKEAERREEQERKQALRDAAPRTVPGEFSSDYSPKTHVGVQEYFEAEFGTYIPGDVVEAHDGNRMKRYHVTGVGREFEADGTLKQRFYALSAFEFGKLTQAERDALPKNDEEAAKLAAKARNARTAGTRAAAKMLGGKALKGTAAQKKWGEEIRKAALKSCSPEQAQRYLNDADYAHAKFWIENRGEFGFPVKSSRW